MALVITFFHVGVKYSLCPFFKKKYIETGGIKIGF